MVERKRDIGEENQKQKKAPEIKSYESNHWRNGDLDALS